MERKTGLKPATSSLARMRSNQLSYFRTPFATGGSRTHDTRLFRPLLYQLSYRGKIIWVVQGSNLRHLRCKRSALPAELTTLIHGQMRTCTSTPANRHNHVKVACLPIPPPAPLAMLLYLYFPLNAMPERGFEPPHYC